MTASWKKISFVLLALVLGVAMAWIRPAQPKQVELPATMPNFARKTTSTLLDNDDIPLENGIHNSRKCGFCMVRTNYLVGLYARGTETGKSNSHFL